VALQSKAAQRHCNRKLPIIS